MGDHLRRAIQRIGERYSPPADAFDRVVQQRERHRRQSRILAGLVALLVVAGATSLLVRAFGFPGGPAGDGASLVAAADDQATPTPEETPEETPTPPNCPVVGEGGYQATLAPASGTPGSTVMISGPVPMYRPDGTYDPARELEIEIWWNVASNEWDILLPGGDEPSPGGPGPVQVVAEEDVSDMCSFQLEFTVPDVPSGTYNVLVLEVGGDGAAVYSETPFEVTS